MHERDWAECRFAHGSTSKRQTRTISQWHAPDRRKLHEEIVRMLAIHERTAIESFADLEQFSVAAPSFGGGIEAQHRIQRQPRRSDVVRRLTHPPVGSLELCRATRSALMIEDAEQHAILHEVPSR